MSTVNLTEYFDQPHPGHVALACASLGWPVLPFRFVNGAKRPLIKRWQTEATIDPDVIKWWWSNEFPNAYVGIVTGRRSGIWVLDVDKKAVNGFATLLGLLRAHGIDDRPDTFTVQTPSGGEHWYFAYPDDGRDIANSASKRLGPGLDTRGFHGFVAAPCQRGYQTLVDDVPLATAWRWLEALVEKRKHVARNRGLVVAPGIAAARLLELEAGRLAATPTNAGRNSQLNTSAFLLALNGVDRDAALATLLNACSTNGLLADDGEDQCLQTFDSGWDAGLAQQEESA